MGFSDLYIFSVFPIPEKPDVYNQMCTVYKWTIMDQ